VNAHRLAQLQPDRGGRQHLKVMQLLAAVDGDGATPLPEALVASVSRIRRGMTAIVITASMQRDWIKPLASLKSRGIAVVAITMDIPAFEAHERALAERAHVEGRPPEWTPAPEDEDGPSAQAYRALRHALAEFDITVYRVGPTSRLAAALAS